MAFCCQPILGSLVSGASALTGFVLALNIFQKGTSNYTEEWSCIPGQPLHHGVCHLPLRGAVPPLWGGSRPSLPNAPSLIEGIRESQSSQEERQRRCVAKNRLVLCDSQDLSKTLPHAMMTMRKGSREVRSHTPQRFRPRGSAHQRKQPSGLWICHN